MKSLHRVLGISNLILISGVIISAILGIILRQDQFFFLMLIMMAVILVLTIVLMFSYKNRTLIKVVFYGMPVSLLLCFVFKYFHLPSAIPVTFYLCFVVVNLVIHFVSYDLNLIVLTFLIILGLLFKNQHYPFAGLIMTLSILLSEVFLLILAFRAFRIKDNKYMSLLIFSCCLVLAATYMSFIWKIQHWPGAGAFSMIMLPAFIIATLIILLTLPGSNFIEWTRHQKRILLRGLLVPWLFFIYIFTTTLLIPPHNQFKPFFFLKKDTLKENFYMEDYEVENRNGLE